MNLKVIEGRLTEMQVGVGVERRAFGEFVGPHGELASYAFGWTTESEPVRPTRQASPANRRGHRPRPAPRFIGGRSGCRQRIGWLIGVLLATVRR